MRSLLRILWGYRDCSRWRYFDFFLNFEFYFRFRFHSVQNESYRFYSQFRLRYTRREIFFFAMISSNFSSSSEG